jgi:hypothetical protein
LELGNECWYWFIFPSLFLIANDQNCMVCIKWLIHAKPAGCSI